MKELEVPRRLYVCLAVNFCQLKTYAYKNEMFSPRDEGKRIGPGRVGECGKPFKVNYVKQGLGLFGLYVHNFFFFF